MEMEYEIEEVNFEEIAEIIAGIVEALSILEEPEVQGSEEEVYEIDDDFGEKEIRAILKILMEVAA